MSDLKTELEKGISEAQALVDDVKVRVHLAGMDAKDEWNKLEPKVTAQLTSLKRDLSSATKDAVDDLCIVVTVWLDPRCAGHAELDKKDLYRTNYEAMKLAIARALKGEPSIDELIKNRKSIKHYALEGVVEN